VNGRRWIKSDDENIKEEVGKGKQENKKGQQLLHDVPNIA
jgi:hypothetical protein